MTDPQTLKEIEMDYLNDPVEVIEEQERAAYSVNDARLSQSLAAIVELRQVVDELEGKIDDTVTLEQWEKENGPAENYKAFFESCFDHLDGNYPCPSVTSDYDKGVIFEAIQRGESSRDAVE